MRTIDNGDACGSLIGSIAVTNTPNSTGTNAYSDAKFRSVADELDAALLAWHNESAERDRLVMGLNGAYENMSPSTQTAGGADRKNVDQMVGTVYSRLEKSLEAGRKRAAAAAQRMFNIVAGTSVGEATRWMNKKNKNYTRWANAKGHLNLWFGVFGHEEGLDTYENRLVTNWETAELRKRSSEVDFRERQLQLNRELEPYAIAAGMSLQEFGLATGKYANCLHAEEANVHIRERILREISDLNEWYGKSRKTDADAAKYAKARSVLNRQLQVHDKYVNSSLKNIPEADLKYLRIAGYTNADARANALALIDRCGVGKDVMDNFAARYTEEFNYILSKRAEAGVLDPEVVKTFPNFRHYVPMMSIENSNNMGNMYDCAMYNPGSYRALKGNRGSEPDSAYATLDMYAQRAAMEIGYRDVGVALDALYNRLDAQGVKRDVHHLARYDYDEIRKMANARDPDKRRMFDLMTRGKGFVATIRENGATRKKWFVFDDRPFDARGGKFDGSLLNEAFASNFHLTDPGRVQAAVATATGMKAQLVTRLTPSFAMIAGMRDFAERAFNMPARTYVTEDGRHISGATILPAMAFNTARAASSLIKGLHGTLDPNAKDAGYYREFVDGGLMQKFLSRMKNRDKPLSDILEGKTQPSDEIADRLGLSNMKGFRKLKSLMGNAADRVLGVLDRWNDYFQNVAAFDQFISLRDRGVDAASAVEYVAREMDLSKRGTMTPLMQMMAPFSGPTVQSGLAMARSLGMGADKLSDIPKKGWKGALTVGAAAFAYSMLLPLVKESMGEDENGVNRFDALSLDQASRFVPIGFGDGDYFKFPIGYGFPNVGAMLAVGADRVDRGEMNFNDLMCEVAYGIVQNMSPGGWPEYRLGEDPMSFVATMITPDIGKPVVEAAMNRSYFGSDIYRNATQSDQAKSGLGRASTAPRYHEVAKWMHDAMGIDLQPEVYKHLWQSYMTGPLRAFTLWADDVDGMYKNKDIPDTLHTLGPVMTALGGAYMYGRQNDPTKSRFFDAERYYDAFVRDLGINLALPPGEKDAEAYRRRVLADADVSQERIDDIISIWRAKQECIKHATTFSQNYKRRWLANDTSEEIFHGFDALRDADNAVYARVVRNLNLYRGQGGTA